MTKKKIFLKKPSDFYLLLVKTIFFFLISFPLYGIVHARPLEDCKEHAKYGIPNNDPVLLCREAYLLSHSFEYKIPMWVAYHLKSDLLDNKIKRSGQFRPDPDLPKGERAELKDYENSGFDRGHMMPAADAKRSKKAMNETFLLSNMAPQVGIGFNRGIWEELEKKVRQWAEKLGELYVYVGPIFSFKDIKTIGTNRVAVPSHFLRLFLILIKWKR